MIKNRTKFPQKKAQMYQQMLELPKKYSVTALVRMEKVRASQLLPLRKKLLGEVEIVSIKDKIAKKAFEKLDVPGAEKMKEMLTGQCVFHVYKHVSVQAKCSTWQKQSIASSQRWRHCKHRRSCTTKEHRNSSWPNAY